MKKKGRQHNNLIVQKEDIIMKKAFLSLAAILACVSITTAAQASRDEYYERGEHGERYEGRGYDDGGRRYEESKFYGTVEAIPQGGRDGIWRISGRDVVVTSNTFIKEEYGRMGIGAQVEVKGGGAPFMAYEIEVKSGSRAMGNAPVMNGGIKFYGPIEAMPQGGFLGTWRVGGRDVLVTQNTFIKQEYGRVAPGVQVEVKGSGTPFVAYEIEVKGGIMR
jgi:hypothetical protein